MKNKFGAIRTNGYASKGEAKRAEELKLLEKAGQISDLKEQVRFVLIPKQDGLSACSYIADFQYMEDGVQITEDYKGCITPVFEIKRKLMMLVHGIKIRVTR